AFFASPFEESAVLTINNCGEPLRRLGGASLSITLSAAAGTSFRVLEEHKFPECSPGLLYHWFTTFLGFRAGKEGKTMDLSSYGTESCYRALVPKLQLKENGSFCFLTRTELRAALADFGAKPRLPGTPILPVHNDVAKAGQ